MRRRKAIMVYALIIAFFLLCTPFFSIYHWNFESKTAEAQGLMDRLGAINGSAPGDLFGWNVSWAGDLNGDGYDDFIAGAPFADGYIGDWWNPDWMYRKKLVFDNSLQGVNLDNFPVLINLSSFNFDYLKAKPDGTDLRFIDSDGSTELKYHIESWNPSGNSYLWVNVTQIDSGSNSDFIWMYYNNSNATDVQDAKGTYVTGFLGVWHLNETSGVHYDATINHNEGYPQNGLNQDALGIIDGADDFDGTDDHINLRPVVADDYTIDFWFKGGGTIIGYENVTMKAAQNIRLEGADTTLYAERGLSQLGYSVSSGDINGDGINDTVMGSQGSVYVVYGKISGPAPAILDLDSDYADIAIYGEAGDRFGTRVATGDINNDGFDDLLIGAMSADTSNGTDVGAAYVIYGADYVPGTELDLTIISANLTIYGNDTYDYLGRAVSSGDVNKDGYDDVIVGASGGDPGIRSSAGEIYVFYGAEYASGTVFDLNSVSANLTIFGNDSNDIAGSALCTGDINNDGYEDMIIGAPGGDPLGGSNAGETYVIFGGDYVSGSLIDLNASAANLTVYGGCLNDSLGFSVASGDFNNDGFEDVIIGAYWADYASVLDVGATYIIFGANYPAGTSLDLNSSSADITIYGNKDRDYLGYSVASGDINDDGFDDAVIGAYQADSPGGINTGAAYVIYGADYASGTVFNLNVTSANLTIYGDDMSDLCGNSVSTGDINDDGYSDLIIGAYGGDPPGGFGAGEVHVIYGANQTSPFVIDLDKESANLTICGDDGTDVFGRAISAGDVNNDGYADLIVGASGADAPGRIGAGRVYVFFGKSEFTERVDLAVDSADITVYGDDAGDSLGGTISTGDVNCDGFDDLIMGVSGAYPLGRTVGGKTYVIFGGNHAPGTIFDLNATSANVTIYGASNGDQSGKSVAAGDINNDGYDDVILGALWTDAPNGSNEGAVYVVYGSDFAPGTIIDLNSVSANLTIYGENASDYCGYAVSSGDVNCDGFDDVIVGAYNADPLGRSSAGKVYVVFGADYAPNSSLVLKSESANLTVWGNDTEDYLGYSVSCGDINGDGYSDIIIGAYDADGPGKTDAGGVYVIFGSNFAPGSLIDLNSQPADLTVYGKDGYERLGRSVYSSDVNNDGISDLITGAYMADPLYVSQSGETYVIYGGNFSPSAVIDLKYAQANLTISGKDQFDRSGAVVCSADLNSDGFAEIIIGAYEADYKNRLDSGEVYVVNPISFAQIVKVETLGSKVRAVFAPSRNTSSVVSGDIDTSSWHHVTVTKENELRLYIDGVLIGSSNVDSDTISIALNLTAGVLNQNGSLRKYFWGAIDELRMVDNPKSPEWVHAQHLSMSDNFITFFAETTSPPSGGNISDSGAAYIFFGYSGISPTHLEISDANVTIYGGNLSDQLGWDVTGAGDLNNDGYNDIIIGAPGWETNKGRVYIFHGRAVWNGSYLSAEADVILSGENQGDRFGHAVAGFTDLTADILLRDWELHKSITIDSGRVAGDLFDFPLLINITDSDLKEKARSDAYDVIFTTSDTKSLLDFEIESYDNTTGHLVAWVRIPFLSLSEDTLIYMHYGNSKQSSSLENPSGVWSNNFTGVWHLEEDGAGQPDEFTESTSNGAHGQGGGGSGTKVPSMANGKVGRGQSFDGIDDHINISKLDPQLYNDFTISAWFKSNGTTAPDEGYMLWHFLDNRVGPGIGFSTTNDPGHEDRMRLLICKDAVSSKEYYGASDVVDEKFHHIVGVRDNGRIKIYIDGAMELDTVDQNAGEILSVDTNIGPFMGDFPPMSEEIAGILDEVQLSSTGRSFEWIVTSYKNQNETEYFYTLGAEEKSNWGENSSILIGACGYDNNRGRAYLFQIQSGLSGELQASTANCTITGGAQNDRLGWDISGILDFNGDGRNDMIISAPGNYSETGASYVILGNYSYPSKIDGKNADVVLVGENAGCEFGYSVSDAQDLNGDGRFDIIIGSPGNNGGTGAAYIFFGRPLPPPILYITDSNHTMSGENPGDRFGFSVKSAGDLDSDFIPDVAVGAPFYDLGPELDAGAVYMFKGGPGMNTQADWICTGVSQDEHFGFSLAYAGNLAQDGSNYLAVGAPNNQNNGPDAGCVYILQILSPDITITDILAIPPVQQLGGAVNITCNVSASGSISSVWVNLSVPVGGFLIDPMMQAPLNQYFYQEYFFIPGIYYYTILVYDTYGNVTMSAPEQFEILNGAPFLSFEQVVPSSGFIGSDFNFTVQYAHSGNESPLAITVNITGPSHAGSWAMMEEDEGDADYNDGKAYYYNFTGFGLGSYSFYFSAVDPFGNWVICAPLSFEVVNRPPSLSLPQVSPNTGNLSSTFNFTVTYTDLDSHLPETIAVNITGIGDFDLLESDPIDIDTTDGKAYYLNTSGFPLGSHSFFFAAKDEGGDWVQTATLGFDVLNRPPILSSGLLNPVIGYFNSAYNFSVIYSDPDNHLPQEILLNISGLGDFSMLEVSSTDMNCTNGKMYYLNFSSLPVGSYTYHFAALDNKGLWAAETPEVSGPDVLPFDAFITIIDFSEQFSNNIPITATLLDNNYRPIANQSIFVYIDLNRNGGYETNELVGIGLTDSIGAVAINYTGNLTPGPWGYAAFYNGSSNYAVTNDIAQITIVPKTATLLAVSNDVQRGEIIDLSALLITTDGKRIRDEVVAFYIDSKQNEIYEVSDYVSESQTSSEGVAEIAYLVNLAPGDYGFWAKYVGSQNYTVNEIKGVLSVYNSSNKPPMILWPVPNQIKTEDCPPWTLDLTLFEVDLEDSGSDLKWFLTDVDTNLVTVTGMNSTDDVLTFIPRHDAYGSDKTMLWLVDSSGNYVSQTLWINITPINDAPYFNPLPPNLFVRYDDKSTAEDDPTPWDFSFYVHDVETPPSELVITTSEPSSDSGSGYAEVNGLSVAFHYPKSRVGESILVTIMVSDGQEMASTVIRVHVTSEWVPELIGKLPNIVLYENTTLFDVFDLEDYFTDRDHNNLYFSSGFIHINVSIKENNTVDISSDGEWTGTEFVTFRAMDPVGAIVEDTITVTVIPVNDGPVISGVPDLVVHYDYSYAFDLSPYVYDPDNHTYEIKVFTSEPLNHIWVSSNNNLEIVVNFPKERNGMTIPVTVFVTDGLETAAQQIMITVTDDFPPEVVSKLPDIFFNEDTWIKGAFSLSDYFFDFDGDMLFYTSGNKFVNVTINNDLTVDFSAPLNWWGSERVTFRAADPSHAIAEDTILVVVVPVNDAPEIYSIPKQERRVGEEWVLDISQYVNDVDNDRSELKISAESESGLGYVEVAGNILLFSYPKDVYEDIVTVTVSDGSLETSRSFIVSIKGPEPKAASFFESIPWLWILFIIFISFLEAVIIFRRKNRYKVYEVFLIHEKGLPLAHASRKKSSELEDVVVSGMFTAVQDFISDAFSGSTKDGDWELDEMKFGENKILIERSDNLFLAVIFEGNSDRLRTRVKRLLGDINLEFSAVLADWDGDMSRLKGIRAMTMTLLESRSKDRRIKGAKTPEPAKKPVAVETVHEKIQTHEEVKVRDEHRTPDEIIDVARREISISGPGGLARLTESLSNEEIGDLICAKKSNKNLECPVCGGLYGESDARCPRCGTEFERLKKLPEQIFEGNIKCAACGTDNDQNASSCSVCGSEFLESEGIVSCLECPRCGAEVDESAKSCPYCGLEYSQE